jgi:hypothetical protein
MAAGSVIARILTQYSDKGTKAAAKDFAIMSKKIDKFASRARVALGAGIAAAGVLAVKLAADAVKGAALDEQQQISLAIAIRNTTSATEDAIKANSRFLDALELQVGIDNEQLMPALQKLTMATGDLGQAQNLLALSIDVAAASGKGLDATSSALSKAIGGNFTALRKLGLPLDANAIKSKNLSKLLLDLAKISEGQGAAAANTFAGKLTILKLSFNQVMDELGVALMPAIMTLVNYITTDVIPKLSDWVELNESFVSDKFVQFTETLLGLAKSLVKLAIFVDKYSWLIIPLGVISGLGFFTAQLKLILETSKFLLKFAINPLFNKLGQLGYVLKEVGSAFKTSGARGSLGAIKVFVDLLSKRVKILLGLLAGIGAIAAIAKTLSGPSDTEILAQMRADQKKAFQKEKDLKNEAAIKASQAKIDKTIADQIAKDTKVAGAAQAKIDAAKLKADKMLADQKKKLAALGVKTITDEDPKQLNAAIALLERQKNINAVDAERLLRLKEEVLLLKVRNDLATRYEDILKALADNKITTQEVQILALKWGITTDAVDGYLLQLKIVEDGTISDAEVIALAQSWGSTQAQAAQYLDFFNYLNDGILSDAEIEKLKSKWKLTEDQVSMYADFVGVVNDGKLSDAEIIKIQEKWKLTTDQVVAYLLKLGAPVTYSGTLIDPATAAELAWKNATTALLAYLALLAKGTGVVVPGSTDGAAAASAAAQAAAAATAAAEAARKAAEDKARAISATASSSAANQYATAKAAGDMAAAAIAAARVTPSNIAAGESGAIGAASIAAKLAAAEQSVQNASIAANLAAFKAKEAADLARSILSSQALDDAERARFRNLTAANAGSTMNSSGISSGTSNSTNIVINVAGSVTSEQDLVQTVRNGLLNAQYNGNAITLQAI